MAPTCCAAPFPALKPNPIRSFLSAGRGDYPKGFLECGSVARTLIQGEYQQAKDYQRDGKRLRNPNPAPTLKKKFHGLGSHIDPTTSTTLRFYKIILSTAQ